MMERHICQAMTVDVGYGSHRCKKVAMLDPEFTGQPTLCSNHINLKPKLTVGKARVTIAELETQNELLRTESNGYQSAAEGHCKRVVELEARLALLEQERDGMFLRDNILCAEKVELEGRIAAAIESLDSGDPDEPVWSIEGELKIMLRGED